jgi:predicted dehydrogenase
MSDARDWNRREFMTAAAAGLVIVSGLRPASAADVESVRVAVVGTGSRGSDLIRKLTTIEGVQLVAICDDYEPHLKKAAEFAGAGAKLYSDHGRMLEEARPRVVVVATPLYMHFAVCADALDAGCDVFCEKTMTYGIDEGRKLAAKVGEKRAVFQVGLQRRANPIYQQAKAMIEAGLIGRVSAIKAQWHRNNNWRRPVPVGRSDPKWKELERRLNWRLYRPYSGGLMTELGSHQLDVANWMLDALPQRATGVGGVDYWRDGRELPDNVFCTYEYRVTPKVKDASAGDEPYTVRVTYSSICNNAFEGASELIMGTKGTLFLTERKGLLYRERGVDDVGWARPDQADANASIVTAGKTLGLSNDPWAHRSKPVEIDNGAGDENREQLVSFLEHVRQRDVRTICDVNAGLRNAATSLVGIEAIEAGSAVRFPEDLRST